VQSLTQPSSSGLGASTTRRPPPTSRRLAGDEDPCPPGAPRDGNEEVRPAYPRRGAPARSASAITSDDHPRPQQGTPAQRRRGLEELPQAACHGGCARPASCKSETSPLPARLLAWYCLGEFSISPFFSSTQ
jgi:hypothetical protein